MSKPKQRFQLLIDAEIMGEFHEEIQRRGITKTRAVEQAVRLWAKASPTLAANLILGCSDVCETENGTDEESDGILPHPF